MPYKVAAATWRLQWSDMAQSTVRIRYSIDGGAFSNVIDDSAPNGNGPTSTQGYYDWTVPTGLVGSDIVVRVLDATEDDIYIESPSYTVTYGSRVILGAIKIKLNSGYDTRTDIGLYNVDSSNTEIRWSEMELVDVDDTYNYEMLLDNGIGNIRRSFDYSLGGNVETINNFTVRCKGSNQVILRLAELGIDLSGKTIEYIEFDGIDLDSDYYSETVMFTGTIENIESNQFETVITAKTSFQYKRNRLLGDTVSETDYPYAPSSVKNGVTPVTFGESDPDNGRYFKFIQVADKEEVLKVDDMIPTGNPSDMYLFPVARVLFIDYESNEIGLLLGDFAPYNSTDFEGMYVQIIEAPEESTVNVNEIRKIESLIGKYGVTVTGYGNQNLIVFELSEYLPSLLSLYYVILGDAGLNVFATFAKIIDVLIEYAMDHDYCDCFNGVSEIYIKSGDNMVKAIDLGISQITPAIPIYEINSSIFSGEIGNTKSYTYLPVESIEPYESATDDLGVFEIDEDYEHPLDGSSDKVAGVFCEKNSGCKADDQGVITGANNFNDRDHTTQYLFEVYLDLTETIKRFDYYIAIKVELPEIPDTIDFDSVYLGINCNSILADNSSTLEYTGEFAVCYRSYYNRVSNPFSYTSMQYAENVEINCLPDDYYTSGQDESNKQFYFLEETETKLAGYKKFDLDIGSVDDYRNIHEMVILFKRYANELGQATYINDNVYITDLAIIFEKNVTLGESIYA